MEFDEEVVFKSGAITLTDAQGNALAPIDQANFDLQSNGTNSVLTFQISAALFQLQPGTDYRLYIAPFNFEDLAGNDYAGTGVTAQNGIDPGVNWQFTTADLDKEIPEITCPIDIVQDSGTSCSTVVTITEPTATDNVSSFSYEGYGSLMD